MGGSRFEKLKIKLLNFKKMAFRKKGDGISTRGNVKMKKNEKDADKIDFYTD